MNLANKNAEMDVSQEIVIMLLGRQVPVDMGVDVFRHLWGMLGALFLGLHPDGYDDPDSGWPEELKPMAAEAFRRFEAGLLSDEELYWMPAHECFLEIVCRRRRLESGSGFEP